MEVADEVVTRADSRPPRHTLHEVLSDRHLRQRAARRLWIRVENARNPEECWRWRGPIDGNGYAVVCVGFDRFLAARVVWALITTEIPQDGQIIERVCCNRACVNPSHGRLTARAGRVPRWTLTDEQVEALYRRYLSEPNMTIRMLAADAGISREQLTRRFSRMATVHRARVRDSERGA